MTVKINENYFDENTIIKVNFLTQDSDDIIKGDWHTDIYGYITNLGENDFPKGKEYGYVIKEEQIKRNIKYYLPELVELWNAEMHDNITAKDIEEITVDTY